MTDPKGNEKKIQYNSRGQPIKITHPDGTYEQFLYRKDGQLVMQRGKDGVTVYYERDPLGRVIEEKIEGTDGKEYKKITHTYNAFHLLTTTDPEGVITTYEYDGAGRLEWIRREGRIQQNFYDSLGRLSEVREWSGDQPHEYRSTMTFYDFLNRVTKEVIQAPDKTELHVSIYDYDAKGNRTFVQNGEQITLTEYDGHNNPVKITNALNQTTHTVYRTDHVNSLDQKVLQSITTDPLGYQTIDTYDTANRLVETTRKNPYDVIVARQEVFYDLCSNPSRIVDSLIEEGEINATIERITHYNSVNQETNLYEAAGRPEQKITKTSYDRLGRKRTITKNDGTKLIHEYDPLGRLERFYSSDTTIDYHYEHNLRDQVTRVKDLHTGQITEREYNTLGEMEVEKFGHGLAVSYTYDLLGRHRLITFPDQTAVEYVYNALDLKEVHRIKNGKRLFTHSDQSHNLAGQVKHAKLGNQSEIDYEYDRMGRCIQIKTKQFNQIIPIEGFDAAGNLRFYYTEGKPHTFDYDDHYQLKAENGYSSHSYRYDSLSNRIAKNGETHEHNGLHQLLKTEKENFSYNKSGNMIQRTQNGKETTYSYDALDRLIEVTHEGKTTTYEYDPFNRRLVKKQPGETDQLFIYQGEEEVGLWTEGQFQELRFLGKNPRMPTLAIELGREVFVPIYDLAGNVVCLQNSEGDVVERYRYTAFGENEILTPEGELLADSLFGNAWQYAGKRLDKETGLIAFGLRYYDPGLGRWITPDPAGFGDGPNLYAYVQNSPLRYYDRFGLFSLSVGVNLNYDNNNNDRFSNYKDGGTFGVLQQHDPSVSFFSLEHYLLSHQTQEQHFNSLSLADDALPAPWDIERATRYDLNDFGYTHPETQLPYQFKNTQGLSYGFVNGIKNRLGDFKDSLLHLGRLADHNMVGIHSPSFGLGWDAVRYGAARFCVATETVQAIHGFWHTIFKMNPQEYLCWTCHSRGAVDTRNALLSFPADLRQRITVIAVAPGCFIEKHLCGKIVHLVSRGDVVPWLDRGGMRRCHETIEFLQPTSSGFGIDHSLMSETYVKPLRRHYKLFYAGQR